MTSTDNSPWSDIQKPVAGYSIKRVDADHPHDFFWGKDADGNYLLLLKLTKELAEILEVKNIDLHGVKTDITYHTSTSEYFFKLSLQNKEDADIFHRLCFDLIDRTKEVLVRNVALEVIINRLKRWKAFLRGKKKYILSARAVRGLFAELEFVQKALAEYGDQLTVLEGWQGPLDEPQDFVLGDFAVEIKSLTGLQKEKVKISSEHQLVTHLENLFLHVIYLAEFHDCKKGRSLNTQVDVVRDAIKDPDHKEVFDSRLYATGYLELKAYDAPCYAVTKQESFHVREGFPRISPEDLDEGVSGVTYDLDLKSLDSYVCELPLNKGEL
jgi:hypothetical protein